ncbi:iodotyrosine deiodinase [Mesorhizobium soli]|jgi:nitroreductase|uniref:nitroreductase family protein n=1 Tax=Pseudaminobacter soli (ex Li et al. 2025) TaxID=1295366 RepID=UPI0024744235|nr:nitroreductase family protein [Mesorhizobium soli]MDH6232452.1 iodotyrosine deiodinase [Mesorhizobium soli]
MRDHDSVPLPDYRELEQSEMIARAASFYEEIKRRHTVRSFSPRPVPREIIEHCIMAAGTAPSGANHQPWFFSAIGDPETKREIREKAEIEERAFYLDRKAGEAWLEALAPLGTDEQKPYLEIAPWLIGIFAQRRGGAEVGEERKNYYIAESVGIATGFLINALHSCGLVTLTHTPKPMDFLNTICGRPDHEKPFMLLVVGYPGEDATVPMHALKKKTLEQIASFI